MVTYLVYALPTVLLSLLLGVALGWLTWGRRHRSGQDAERDDLRRLAVQRARDLADRDSTIAILREELASEASDAARVRRLLAGAEPGHGPAAANGRPEPSPSVFTVAARRAAVADADAQGIDSAGDPLDGPRRSRRRLAES
ncbi:MAG: hypothetical protein ACFCUP_05505 [Actinomycetales bacterium]